MCLLSLTPWKAFPEALDHFQLYGEVPTERPPAGGDNDCSSGRGPMLRLTKWRPTQQPLRKNDPTQLIRGRHSVRLTMEYSFRRREPVDPFGTVRHAVRLDQVGGI